MLKARQVGKPKKGLLGAAAFAVRRLQTRLHYLRLVQRKRDVSIENHSLLGDKDSNLDKRSQNPESFQVFSIIPLDSEGLQDGTVDEASQSCAPPPRSAAASLADLEARVTELETAVLDAVKAKAFGVAESLSKQFDARREELEALRREIAGVIDLASRRGR